MEEEEAEGEAVELHRAINPQEASHHVMSLDDALKNMESRIETGEEKDILKDTVTLFKDTISQVVPQVAEADTAKVVCAISDPTCLALHPRTDEREEMLEMVMPLENAPEGEEVVTSIEGNTPLTDSQQNLLREVFEDLEVAHEHTSRACSGLTCLSMTLSAPQLMATLRAMACPLILINTLEGFLDKIKTPRKMELPDNKETRVKITMTPNPNVKCLLKEKTIAQHVY